MSARAADPCVCPCSFLFLTARRVSRHPAARILFFFEKKSGLGCGGGAKHPTEQLRIVLVIIFQNLRIRGVQLVGNFPFLNELPEAFFVAFIFDRGGALGPLEKRFEINFVTPLNDDVGDLLGFDGPSDRSLRNAEQARSFRNRDTNDGIKVHMYGIFINAL